MDTDPLTPYQQHLIAWAKKDAASKRNDWPGFPLVQIPVVGAPELHDLVNRGYLKLVKRPGRISGTHTYVVAVER